MLEDAAHAVNFGYHSTGMPFPQLTFQTANVWGADGYLEPGVESSEPGTGIGAGMASEARRILEAAGSVLVVDWPSRDVPDTLARAGYAVCVKGGPEPDNYSVYKGHEGKAEERRPDRVDLVYVHRPVAELPGIVATAKALGASAVWYQSGIGPDGAKDPTGCSLPAETSRQAREIVERAGPRYGDD